MDGYREFWNQIFYGESRVVGTNDIQTYWLRLIIIVGLFALAGVASSRLRWLPLSLTTILVAIYLASVGPFMIWAARCGGCGASFSYDTPRSYEAMLLNQWWGGLIAMAIGSLWIGTLLARRRSIGAR